MTWATRIRLIVPRSPHAISTGDASHIGGGAFCHQFEFWFATIWSPAIVQAEQTKSIHINQLEFTVMLIQLASLIVQFRSYSDHGRPMRFPQGVPSHPVALILSDNTSSISWSRKITTKSEKGQNLLGIYAELLRFYSIGDNCEHIAGIDYDIADFLSRPTDISMSSAARCEQIFQTHGFMRTWLYFRPSPALLRLISSSLLLEKWQGRPKLPENLGQFVPVESITSNSHFKCAGMII
jgi:hypothetical protein